MCFFSVQMIIFIFLIFLFYIGVQPINKVVIVSGGQQTGSAIHTHVSILPQTSFPSRLPRNIEQSPLCSTVGLCWLSLLNTAACTYINPKLSRGYSDNGYRRKTFPNAETSYQAFEELKEMIIRSWLECLENRPEG